jgi:hypothetical protein
MKPGKLGILSTPTCMPSCLVFYAEDGSSRIFANVGAFLPYCGIMSQKVVAVHKLIG